MTRHGLEEYVSDCVIFLDHRLRNQVATRRLRIVKYRGSVHGTNEYPTLIDEHGLSVLPVSSLGLTYPVSNETIPSGVSRLDNMLAGKGYYRGSSILVTGTAGTGKTSLAAALACTTCQSGEKVAYFAYEESPEQILRKMASIGYDLQKWTKKGLLSFHPSRPILYGLEMHLASIHRIVSEENPSVVIMDPITNMTSIGEVSEVSAMLGRVIDFLKNKGITAFFTSLTSGGEAIEQSEVGISSLMDTWLLLKIIESNGERNRLMYVMKSRGMAHSNQMREFILSKDGIQLSDVYIGPGQVLTGTGRMTQEARDRSAAESERQSAERQRRELEHEKAALRAQIETLQQKMTNIDDVLKTNSANELQRRETIQADEDEMKSARRSD